MPTDEIWILGGTGRIGRAVAERLARDTSSPLVLLGRNRGRLEDAAALLPRPARTLVAPSHDAMAVLIATEHPLVVVNALGSYSESATSIAHACLSGGHYVDLANDVPAVSALLALHDEAAAAGSTLITGAGFGVLATEAIVAALCAGRPTPASVQVDAIASVASEGGAMGAAFAASMIDAIRNGGGAYRDGRLVSTRLGSPVRRLTAPDGAAVTAAGGPSGELIAAQSVSGASTVVATSALVPASALVRAALLVLRVALAIPALRHTLTKRLALMTTKATPRPRQHSWGHAIVEWPDGSRREGWLRADDGMDYTSDVAATVAAHLAAGGAPAGAYTPAAALGADIAVTAGGEFVFE